MEIPKRKPNRLEGYDYSSNGAYFITICVKDRHELLGEIIVGDDAHIVPNNAHIVPNNAHIVPNIKLSEIGIVVQKFINGIIGIDKYVLMPNHIHMIIIINDVDDGTMWASSPTTQSIPQLIKSFKTLVTKKIGFSIWQRSYHDHIIRDEQEYQKIWQYIDENSLKWQEDCFCNK